MVSDTEESPVLAQCENLMNIVVESRKRFGKMCVDYTHKHSLVEDKILKMHLNTVSNYHFKPKHPIPKVEVEDMSQDIDDFSIELKEKQQRIDNLLIRLKNTQEILTQLKKDEVNKKASQSLSAETLLARAKRK